MSQEKTYREIVHLWRHFPIDSSGHISDDFKMSDQAILQHLLDSRSELLRSLDEMGFPIGPQNVQTIPCVELKKADIAECPCAPPSGCVWMKSIKPIPRYIKKSSVTDVTGHDNISYIEWTKVKYKLNSRRIKVKEKKYHTLKDTGEGSHLYVLNTKFLKVVSFSAVFEDPREAREFGGCGKDMKKIICNPWDTPFYIDAGLRNKVIKNSWQVLTSVRQAATEDRKNNDLPDDPRIDNDSI